MTAQELIRMRIQTLNSEARVLQALLDQLPPVMTPDADKALRIMVLGLRIREHELR